MSQMHTASPVGVAPIPVLAPPSERQSCREGKVVDGEADRSSAGWYTLVTVREQAGQAKTMTWLQNKFGGIQDVIAYAQATSKSNSGMKIGLIEGCASIGHRDFSNETPMVICDAATARRFDQAPKAGQQQSSDDHRRAASFPKWRMRILVAPGVTAPDLRTPGEIASASRLIDGAIAAEESFGADTLEAWTRERSKGH